MVWILPIATRVLCVLAILVGAGHGVPSSSARTNERPGVEGFLVAGAGTSLHSPAIDGRTVIWVATAIHQRRGVSEVYGRDLGRGPQFAVTARGTVSTGPFATPAISGRVVVWVDCRLCVATTGPDSMGATNTKIYGKDLTTGRAFQLSAHAGTQESPAISGHIVVWADDRTGQRAICGKDLTTGRAFRVAQATGVQAAPAINGHIVVWQEMRQGTWVIYGKDLTTGRAFRVTPPTSSEQDYPENPAISGSVVIWTEWHADQSVSIEGRDVMTGRSFFVTTIPTGRYDAQLGPHTAISGHVVVWDQVSTGQGVTGGRSDTVHDIYDRDLATGRVVRIARVRTDRAAPVISGNTVVWAASQATTSVIDGAHLPVVR